MKYLIVLILLTSNISCKKNALKEEIKKEVFHFLENDYSFKQFKCLVSSNLYEYESKEPLLFLDYEYYQEVRLRDYINLYSGCMYLNTPVKNFFEAGNLKYFQPVEAAKIDLDELQKIDSWSFVNNEENAILFVLSQVF